jgi:hypothetical protein
MHARGAILPRSNLDVVADDHTREGANELQAPTLNLKLPNRAAGVGLHPPVRMLAVPDASNQGRRYAGRRGLHASTSARSAGGGPARHWVVAALPANVDTLGRARLLIRRARERGLASPPAPHRPLVVACLSFLASLPCPVIPLPL